MVAYEVACESTLKCTTDMFSFKSYLTRWLASTIKLAPFTHDAIMARLKPSAVAAAAQCTGGDNGRTCGLSWNSGKYDGTFGVGQQMAAMSAVIVTMADLVDLPPPFTNATGGTSKGNPNAGSGSHHDITLVKPATGSDRAGAGVLTALILIGATSMFGWMSI
jgi:mannan endo-1,6-alpha-mannosidase